MRWFTSIFICLVSMMAFAQHIPCHFDFGAAEQQVKVGDYTMSYTTAGSGQPVVLIHGLGGHAGHWRINMEALANAGYKVFAINLPGYGGSATVTAVEASDMLRFYASMIDSFVQVMKLEKVVLAGHSMGAQVSMLAALTRPRWLHKLIWIAPAGLETFTQQEAVMIGNFATPAFYKNMDSAAIVAAFRSNFNSMPASAEALVKERLELRACEGFDAYTFTVSAGVKGMLGAPVAGELNEIHYPILLIFGEKDALIPNRVLHPQLNLTTLLSSATDELTRVRTVLVPDAGHMVHWEACKEVNEEMIQFIKR